MELFYVTENEQLPRQRLWRNITRAAWVVQFNRGRASLLAVGIKEPWRNLDDGLQPSRISAAAAESSASSSSSRRGSDGIFRRRRRY